MEYPLSLTPTISHTLDQIRREQGTGSGAEAASLPRWRVASDLLGMGMLFFMLGAYLAVNL